MKPFNFMKPFKKLLLLFVTGTALLAMSCKKDDKNATPDDQNPGSGQAVKNLVTYTIDGGTFHKQQITINADPKALQNGAFSGKYLKVNLEDASADDKTSSKWALDIAFNKVSTGTAKVNDPIANSNVDTRVYFLLQVQDGGKTKYLMSDIDAPATTPGTIKVTKLGSVGGTVEGDFEGKLTDSKDVVYTITAGHFVVNRKS
jgi:hypothetical protein